MYGVSYCFLPEDKRLKIKRMRWFWHLRTPLPPAIINRSPWISCLAGCKIRWGQVHETEPDLFTRRRNPQSHYQLGHYPATSWLGYSDLAGLRR